jgi:hypothetical protein
MLRDYLKIAPRNMRKYKSYSVINVMGLAVGMACCFTILLYVRVELSYEDFHANKGSIYCIVPLIAVLTVSVQTIRTVLANPVEALRYE